MRRVVVLIGVGRAGDLTPLKAVRGGIDQMAVWARSQGISGDDLKILCDDQAPVMVHQISAMIRALVASSTVEQLLVYFSGHGSYNNGERWLLSMAPEDPAEAINVEASMTLARYCSIPHVVFISDACRDAATGIQMQQVTGSPIFPNSGHNVEMPVDIFYACARGSVAFEVANVTNPGAPHTYTALFTSVLTKALRGEEAAVIDTENVRGEDLGYVRGWKLTDYLCQTVPQKLALMLGAAPRTSQLPGSRITSRNAWLSRVAPPPRPKSLPGWKMRSRGGNQVQVKPVLLALFVLRLLEFARTDMAAWRSALNEQHDDTEFVQLQILIALLGSRPASATGQNRLVVRGTRLRQVVGRCGPLAMLSSADADAVLIDCCDSRRVVVVTFNGHGVLVPMMPDRTAELVFKNDVLVDLRYLANDVTNAQLALRATIAAAFNMGALTLPNAAFANRLLRDGTQGDPTNSLYLAYACHEAHLPERAAVLKALSAESTVPPPFDLALLAEAGRMAPELPVTPIPMMSQGWNLMAAFICLTPPLKNLEQHLLPSYWTLFDARGTQQLIAALAHGEL